MSKKEAETIDAKADDIPADDKTTALVNWEEKLAGYAQEAAQEETVLGTWMSTRGGRLSIDKTPVAGNVLDCITIASARENAYYDKKFDVNNPTPPRCYAIQPITPGSDEDEMVPHPDIKDPIHDNCMHCPKNQWKSDPEGGKGKACKNLRRIALLPADAAQSAEAAKAAEVLYLKLPVLSVKNWSKYVNDVHNETRRPPFAVVTKVSTTPDAKAQFKVTFALGYKINDPEVLGTLVPRHERELEAIVFPYQEGDATAEAEQDGKDEKF